MDENVNIVSSDANNEDKLTSISVLIIEDDLFLVRLLEKRFAEANIKTIVAFGAGEAAPMLEKEHIDALLLDILLPDVDGISFLRELRKNPKFANLPVVIISNLGQKDDVKKGLDAGADSYLIKADTDTDEIISVLNKAIKNHQQG